jgi:hypothetical protein
VASLTHGETPSREARFHAVARGIVEQAIGEQMDGNPLPDPPEGKRNPHAVALGSMGGKKGCKARAKKLTAKRRIDIARNVAGTRWE